MTRTIAASLLSAALLLASAAGAAEPASIPPIRKEFLAERANCDRIADTDARHTCRREAGAAYVEEKRGTLAEGTNFEQNRLARCAAYKNAEDRGYCERRMRGEGKVVGSVESGGILRELVVPVPAD